jgi:gas vesicle protein
MSTLNTFEMIVVCLGSGAVGACTALLARIDKATARETRTLRASLRDLAASALEDGEYISELEADVLELTNVQMELQESLHEIQSILDEASECFFKECDPSGD